MSDDAKKRLVATDSNTRNKIDMFEKKQVLTEEGSIGEKLVICFHRIKAKADINTNSKQLSKNLAQSPPRGIAEVRETLGQSR